ncbi:uncharacterized protein KY384_007493 [Bacidia gigantensis]|uniref:uncharacterized protein n=1 Tax=Bacidia gigantensis TaxID=2732470 RepID=UPI001D042B49|nr:uncharacterized protein KY384_007493 [Bacidia gigantensis]KAG8527341.1 hypothetical protein KY384_007493 [Bacidia gigantensis]
MTLPRNDGGIYALDGKLTRASTDLYDATRLANSSGCVGKKPTEVTMELDNEDFDWCSLPGLGNVISEAVKEAGPMFAAASFIGCQFLRT